MSAAQPIAIKSALGGVELPVRPDRGFVGDDVQKLMDFYPQWLEQAEPAAPPGLYLFKFCCLLNENGVRKEGTVDYWVLEIVRAIGLKGIEEFVAANKPLWEAQKHGRVQGNVAPPRG